MICYAAAAAERAPIQISFLGCQSQFSGRRRKNKSSFSCKREEKSSFSLPSFLCVQCRRRRVYIRAKAFIAFSAPLFCCELHSTVGTDTKEGFRRLLFHLRSSANMQNCAQSLRDTPRRVLQKIRRFTWFPGKTIAMTAFFTGRCYERAHNRR